MNAARAPGGLQDAFVGSCRGRFGVRRTGGLVDAVFEPLWGCTGTDTQVGTIGHPRRGSQGNGGDGKGVHERGLAGGGPLQSRPRAPVHACEKLRQRQGARCPPPDTAGSDRVPSTSVTAPPGRRINSRDPGPEAETRRIRGARALKGGPTSQRSQERVRVSLMKGV